MGSEFIASVGETVESAKSLFHSIASKIDLINKIVDTNLSSMTSESILNDISQNNIWEANINVGIQEFPICYGTM